MKRKKRQLRQSLQMLKASQKNRQLLRKLMLTLKLRIKRMQLQILKLELKSKRLQLLMNRRLLKPRRPQ